MVNKVGKHSHRRKNTAVFDCPHVQIGKGHCAYFESVKSARASITTFTTHRHRSKTAAISKPVPTGCAHEDGRSCFESDRLATATQTRQLQSLPVLKAETIDIHSPNMVVSSNPMIEPQVTANPDMGAGKNAGGRTTTLSNGSVWVVSVNWLTREPHAPSSPNQGASLTEHASTSQGPALATADGVTGTTIAGETTKTTTRTDTATTTKLVDTTVTTVTPPQIATTTSPLQKNTTYVDIAHKRNNNNGIISNTHPIIIVHNRKTNNIIKNPPPILIILTLNPNPNQIPQHHPLHLAIPLPAVVALILFVLGIIALILFLRFKRLKKKRLPPSTFAISAPIPQRPQRDDYADAAREVEYNNNSSIIAKPEGALQRSGSGSTTGDSSRATTMVWDNHDHAGGGKETRRDPREWFAGNWKVVEDAREDAHGVRGEAGNSIPSRGEAAEGTYRVGRPVSSVYSDQLQGETQGADRGQGYRDVRPVSQVRYRLDVIWIRLVRRCLLTPDPWPARSSDDPG
ncbi:hypothetical protein B0T16DRAFT_504809 [Cercophora newfieldiana]|uniref:Uncharacterized protein n=1 Tax=Cercophora newfieldiana TaxID=92897 RepID=A0AA40CVN8_9PEZI|nr:hypothetical protein B0T16DRAFT_504809 [Cercophora newfieldiana]